MALPGRPQLEGCGQLTLTLTAFLHKQLMENWTMTICHLAQTHQLRQHARWKTLESCLLDWMAMR